MIKVMLDSGAFSAWRSGKVVDIDEYGEFVKTNRDVFEVCINLDVILTSDLETEDAARASYLNWMYLRQKGIDVMPVYHVGTDERWLEKYLKKTDYICVGAIASLSSNKRKVGLDYIWDRHLRKGKYEPLFKVHGLGVTAVDVMERYPWYSVDSITPLLAAGYGGIFLPAIRKGKFDYRGLDVFKVSDQFKHEATSVGTWLNLPQRHREMYEEEFERRGFKLGKVAGVKRELKSAKEIDTPMLNLGLEYEKSDKETEKTFANAGKERRRWNLLMWHDLAEILPSKPILYVGGTFDVLDEVIRIDVDLGFLFSYIVVNDNFMPRLKKTIKYGNK